MVEVLHGGAWGLGGRVGAAPLSFEPVGGGGMGRRVAVRGTGATATCTTTPATVSSVMLPLRRPVPIKSQ